MLAGRLQTLLIILRSATVTLAITIPTVVEVYRGTYRRETGDRRLRWWSGRLLAYVRLGCRVVNPDRVEIPQGRPVMLMSNHSSLYDIPLVFQALPGSIRMLTKRELFRVPIWGRGLKAGEFVSIDRSDHAQAMRDLAAAREKMASGIVLWVAPEGTRSRDGSLGGFKKGAFMLALETGATIIPIGIRGARDVLPAKTSRFVLGHEAEVRIGRPIEASGYTVEQRRGLMADVERQIRDLANLPTS
ncbi:MAG: lysophospholipid acyltransferase family protein [Candidatus Binatia bacterium]